MEMIDNDLRSMQEARTLARLGKTCRFFRRANRRYIKKYGESCKRKCSKSCKNGS